MKFLEFGLLFGLLVGALYRARRIDLEGEGSSTSWVIPYSILSVVTGVIADIMENHFGLTTWLNDRFGQSEIVSWELIYFLAGVPLAMLAERLADLIYSRRKGKLNTGSTFVASPGGNILAPKSHFPVIRSPRRKSRKPNSIAATHDKIVVETLFSKEAA